jgi:hypothetical protein
MSLQTLSIARSIVLGDYNSRCEMIELIPVFMSGDMNSQVGFVDQSLGPYSGAFSFHLPADICKKLASGQFSFSFGYGNFGWNDGTRGKPRIKLDYICLTEREPVIAGTKPVS